jgi:POT family proton-dependent oligopeptide transporter
MMGLYFAATGAGNKLAGMLGELATTTGEKAVFLGIFGFSTIFGIILLFFLKPLKRLTHGAEEIK